MSFSGELLPPVVRPAQVRFARSQAVNMGPPNAAGPAQRVRSDAGFWTATFSSSFLRGDKLMAWQAFEARIGVEPGVNWHVSPRQCWHSPRRLAGMAAPDGLTHSDGSSFSDGSLYAPDEPDFQIYESADLRSTLLKVEAINGLTLRPGQYFTLWTVDGPRLHLIGGVTATEVTDVSEIKFWPPLRTDIGTDDVISTEEPVCPMLVSSGADGLLVSAAGRTASATLELTETPW